MTTLPGFVDLQVNGHAGVDFTSADLTAEDFRQACRNLRRAGTAALLPTLITAPLDHLRRNLSLIASVAAEGEFAGRLPGIHLEGPFISTEAGATGAHDVRWIRRPAPAVFDDLQAAAGGAIRMLTIAADVPGAEQLARHAAQQGVCVSLGHHLAGEDDLRRLAAAGAKALTHLGNGLPHVLNRHPNPIWAGLAVDELTATIITDGHHLPPAVIQTFLRAKTPGGIVVVSDASPAAGLEPGTYEFLGNTVVLDASGRAYNPDKACLVGSAATILACMNYLAGLGLLAFEDLWAVGFTNPLRLAGLRDTDIDTVPLLRFDEPRRTFELLVP